MEAEFDYLPAHRDDDAMLAAQIGGAIREAAEAVGPAAMLEFFAGYRQVEQAELLAA